MQAQLTVLDIAVVAFYIVGTSLLGAWFTRRQKDLKTYFVGGRNQGWILILASILSTETSIVTFLSVPGLSYDPDGGNLLFLQLSFGYVIGRILIAWFLLPQYMRGELFTAYQLLRERFNISVQRTASALFLITRTLADGLRLFLTGLLFQQFTGWNMEMSIIVVGVVTIVYSFLGGVQAVIWTDLIQVIIYLTGAVVAAVLLIGMIPGGLETVWATGVEAGKFKLFDFDPDPTKTYTIWTGIIGGAVFTMASHGADQLMVQRYLCCRSLREARMALICSGFGVLLQFAFFLLIGVGLYTFYQMHGFQGVAGCRNDEIFGIFIVKNFPPGVLGLVVAAVLAAAMSSSINSAASAFMTDFYEPLQPGRSEMTYVFVSRLMTIFWGLAQMAVALAAERLHSDSSVVAQVLSIAGFTTGMVLGLFILGSMRRPVRSSAALTGFGVGLTVVFGVWLPGFLSLWVESLRHYRYIAWPWYAVIGAGTTVIVALLANAIMNRSKPAPPPPSA